MNDTMTGRLRIDIGAERRTHNLRFDTTPIDGKIAYIACCDCGWLGGPQYNRDVLRAYWHDHVHLTCEKECALHGTDCLGSVDG